METTQKQTLTESGKVEKRAGTLANQTEFPGFTNSNFPRRADVVSKRAPGRPAGSRARVLFISPILNWRGLLQLAVSHFEQARREASFACDNARRFGRHSWLSIEHKRRARADFALALCYILAARALFQGGVL